MLVPRRRSRDTQARLDRTPGGHLFEEGNGKADWGSAMLTRICFSVESSHEDMCSTIWTLALRVQKDRYE